MFDYLIVGAGLFGATFAREMAEAGRTCLVIDRRGHLAGNAHTEAVEGVLVHAYGPHIFHTNDDAVWTYARRFARFNGFVNSPLANYRGRLFNLPFNLHTFRQLWGVQTPEQAQARLDAQRAPWQNRAPQNLEEQALALVGPQLYETLIRGYTEKQWGRPCRELPAAIIRRLPVRLRYDNNYFDAAHQGIPEDGYTAMVARMLDDPRIETRLGVDYLRDRAALRALARRVVYTGAIDAYFDYALGPLAYRSLRFEVRVLDRPDFQGNAVVNYTDAETPYTRIVEHKHFAFGTQPKTVVSYEYPAAWTPGGEAYYPINDAENQDLYARYQALANAEDGVLFGGRLGMYRYYDMDQVIGCALAMAREVADGD